MAFNLPNTVEATEISALAHEAGTLLIDIRPRWRYRQTHIPGSHSIPSGLLLAGEQPEADLVLIGSDSTQSLALIDQLHEQGYNRRIRYLKGGFAAWSTLKRVEPKIQWETLWKQGQQLVGGPALLAVGALTQSIGLLALGLVVWVGPTVVGRSRL